MPLFAAAKLVTSVSIVSSTALPDVLMDILTVNARCKQVDAHTLDSKHLQLFLASRYIVKFIARRGTTIAGFCICTAKPTWIDLLYIATDPAHRRQGIATALVSKAKASLTRTRSRLTAIVEEDRLAAHLLFRKCGLRWIETKRNYYGTGRDAYRFDYISADARITVPNGPRSCP